MTGTDFQLSDSLDSDLQQYRPLSALAVLAGILGAASALALLAVGFWIFAVLGVVLSVIALNTPGIRRNTAGGRRLAIAGLLMSILFLSLAGGRHFYFRHLIYLEAKRVADGWLDLVRQGELEAAHQACLPVFRRQLSAFGLQQAYETSQDLQQKRDQFFGGATAARLASLGSSADYQFVGREQQAVQDRSRIVVLLYQVRSRDQPDPQPFEILLQRHDSWADAAAFWQVLGVAWPDTH